MLGMFDLGIMICLLHAFVKLKCLQDDLSSKHSKNVTSYGTANLRVQSLSEAQNNFLMIRATRQSSHYQKLSNTLVAWFDIFIAELRQTLWMLIFTGRTSKIIVLSSNHALKNNHIYYAEETDYYNLMPQKLSSFSIESEIWIEITTNLHSPISSSHISLYYSCLYNWSA